MGKNGSRVVRETEPNQLCRWNGREVCGKRGIRDDASLLGFMFCPVEYWEGRQCWSPGALRGKFGTVMIYLALTATGVVSEHTRNRH